MEDADDMAFECMDELLTPCWDAEQEAKKELLKGCPMYVLGNKSRINGAVQMCSKDVMERLPEIKVVPSQATYLLWLDCSGVTEDAGELARIVKDVNDTQLAPEEILSYHVYRYSRLTGEVSIAA